MRLRLALKSTSLVRFRFLRAFVLASCAPFACGPSVTRIEMAPSQVKFTEKGAKVTLRADPLDKSGKAIVQVVPQLVWSTSDPKVVTVDKGVVVAVDTGSAKVIAKLGVAEGAADIVVSIPSKLTIDATDVELVGKSARRSLKATAVDTLGRTVDDQPVVWSSGNTAVVSVEGGALVPTGFGATEVKAALGPIVATANVRVVLPKVGAIHVDPSGPVNMAVGGTQKLSVAVVDEAGQPIEGATVIFEASDTKVVAIGATGELSAQKKGRTKVTARVNEASATVDVVVK